MIFYSQLAKEQGLFEFSDVVTDVNQKLTRRHPHVFSDAEFSSEEEIADNWEAEKSKEKAEKGSTEQSILALSLIHYLHYHEQIKFKKSVPVMDLTGIL